MTILLAPDSFKGSLTQKEAIEIMSRAIEDNLASPEIIKVPLADGGEGSLDIFKSNLNYEIDKALVHDQLLNPIEASYAYKDGVVIIESAKACGICLTNTLNPYIASTQGLGELIKEAVIKRKPKKLIIALGGSGTNDLGIGMLEALGAKIYENDKIIHPNLNDFSRITAIDLENVKKLLKNIEVIGISDVKNPLCGPLGATRIFGPQKGIKDEDILKIDKDIYSLASLLNKDYIDYPGSGAAGGLGFAVKALLNGSLKSGIDTILDLVEIDDKIKKADLIFTGEGRFDQQSLNGKVIDGLLKRTKKYNKKLIILCGIDASNTQSDDYIVYKIAKYNDLSLDLIKAKENLYDKMVEILKKINTIM